jgi:hypothetical protein
MRQRESNTPKPERADAPRVSRPLRMQVARCVIAMALLCASAESMAQPTPAHISLEYAVKATYLYKLAPFVNWPPRTFTAPNAPFQICIVGDDPFDDYLEKAVAGHSLGSHPFAVQRLDKLEAGAECQIAFIGHLSKQSLADALSAVEGKPVLTVTDSNASGEDGSIMQFVIEHGRVRFDIDTSAAARNHLAISSKLLNLALAVKDER